ncbi:hypothetical protein [Deinococcus sp.]|uniref:hypothetical protein n=1 Tax=Deinococcus sp. TaxID=47478 RepID=UPI002869E14E|nr:hypothetical protein [Deinococcus sp.]
MTLALIFVGFILMAFNTSFGCRLRRKATGGLIGDRLTQMLAMIALFALGYLAVGVLVFGRRGVSSMLTLSGILLAGAEFVTLVLTLVRDVLSPLD